MSVNLPADLNFLVPFETKMVRMGPREDGGYVLPESVSADTRYLYSLGISTDWRFESAIASSNPGLEIRAYDHNAGSLIFFYIAIRNLFSGYVMGSDDSFRARIRMSWRYLVLGLRFRMFFKFGRRFYRKWVRSVSKSSDDVAFVDSMKLIPDYGNLLIKIDIDGGEYELVNDLVEEIKRRKNQITCIVMELHDTELQRAEFSALVRSIQEHLPIVHIHGNNCAITASDGLPTVVEITFARKDSVSAQPVLDFPRSGLDYPNDSSLPDCEFSFSL